ncbi:MAG TPA: DUF1573 domain-containing protein [Pirellulales bacterium]|nr:DUF1573 domain-containing protein [Pirellulales bacterium]
MKTNGTIAAIVILGIVATAAVSLAQFEVPWGELLASPNLESAGELPDEPTATVVDKALEREQSHVGGKPQAVAEETEFDFGFLPNKSSENEHAFIVKNTGTAPLRLIQADVSCSKCTFATLPADDIPPGGSDRVLVRWNINIEQDVFRQHVDVHTNDREHPVLRFVVFGRIVRPFEIKPAEIALSSIQTGESAEASVQMLSYFSEGLEVVEHHFTNAETAQYFDAQFSPLPADQLAGGIKSGVELKVAVKPGLPLGSFKQRIRLKTNLKDDPEHEIPITGTVVGPVSIIGTGWNSQYGVLVVGHVNRNEGATRKILLWIRGKQYKGLELKPPKVTPKEMHVTYGKISELNEGSVIMVPLTIEIPKDAPSMNHMGSGQGKWGEITISSNNADLPPVKIMVQFAVIEG